ncbi:MAG: DUF6485 family protein [Clostridia bacterium]|nr:DUF6485 family protein [Clostridia bacterium]
MKVDFCTCGDTSCPNHPSNHDLGCTPCILKNLQEREIPACFWHTLKTENVKDSWHYEDFAEKVMEENDK